MDLVKKAQSHYEFEDPLSDVQPHLKPVEITDGGAVYARMQKPLDQQHSDQRPEDQRSDQHPDQPSDQQWDQRSDQQHSDQRPDQHPDHRPDQQWDQPSDQQHPDQPSDKHPDQPSEQRLDQRLDPDQPKLSKIGCASHFRTRINLDIATNKENGIILTEDQYRRIFDLENVSESFYYEIMEPSYNQFMKIMTSHPDLSPLQRRIFKALHFEGGEELGAKKNIMLQIFEYGSQKKLGTSSPAEFLMYADDVVER